MNIQSRFLMFVLSGLLLLFVDAAGQEKDGIINRATGLLQNYSPPAPTLEQPTESPDQAWQRYYAEQQEKSSFTLLPGLHTGTGLYGFYFNNTTLTGNPTLVRTDSAINFNWGTGSPGPGINADNFAVRWVGEVEAENSEVYTFYTYADNGVRLWVDNVLLIERWTNQVLENSGRISLVAGRRYKLRLEFYESTSSATASLSWSSLSIMKTIIPKTQLYPVYQQLQVSTMPSHYVSECYANAAVGTPIAVWGNASGGDWKFRFQLDYGDGIDTSGTVTDPHYIGFMHSYSTGGLKTIGLTVWDSLGNTSTNHSQIMVFAPSEVDTFNIMKYMAIERGLLYLYKKQYPSGYWLDNYGSTGATGMSVLAFEENGHLPGNDPSFDVYSEYVRNGLNYLISQKATSMTIGLQTYGNPDTDGDGKGIYFSYLSTSGAYANGIALLAMLGAHRSGATARLDTINVAPFAGQTYYDFMVDALDMIFYSQQDAGGGRGGWRYNANTDYGSSDNSATQWPALVMEVAQNVWGISIPLFVKSELRTWLVTSQNPSSGGFGYTDANTYPDLAKTGSGLSSYAFLGYTTDSSQIAMALNYLDTNWYSTTFPPEITGQFAGNLYSLYAITKGMRLINHRVGKDSVGLHRWEPEYISHLLTNTPWGQQSDGSWNASYVLGPSYANSIPLSTAFALLVLTPGVVQSVPVAEIEPISVKPPNTPFQLNGSRSWHTDPERSIVEWRWDFNTADGVNWDSPDALGPIPTDAGYADTGTYTIRLRVKDNNDPPQYDEADAVVRITTGNHPPVAIAIPPGRGFFYTGSVPGCIYLDGRASYDPDPGDSIVQYSWDLNGDGIFGDALTDTVTECKTTSYHGTVGLRVYDTLGDSGAAYVDIVTSRMDVLVDEFRIEPHLTYPNDTLTLYANFKKNDSIPSSNVLVRFYDEWPRTIGTQIGGDYYVDLPALGQASLQERVILPQGYSQGGKRNFYVYLDVNNHIFELDELNNLSFDSVEILTHLDQPTLLAPADSTSDVSLSPKLHWSHVYGAQSYRLQLSSAVDFDSSHIVCDDTVSDTSKQVSGLSLRTEYFWRVKALFRLLQGEYSVPSMFTTGGFTSIYLTEGWNMVSLPRQPDDRRTISIFPAAISPAFAYQGGYVAKETLDVGEGYWLKFARAETISIRGMDIVRESVSVGTNWNIIGSLTSSIPIVQITSDPGGIITSGFFNYKDNRYESTDTIEPGKGYWVKVNNGGKLILSSSGSVFSANLIKIQPDGEMPPRPPGRDIVTLNEIPSEYILGQAYPNPLNPRATLNYELPMDSRVKLTIYNVLGEVVDVLCDAVESAGYKSVEWNASSAASGMYFYRLDATSMTDPSKAFTQVKKMILLK